MIIFNIKKLREIKWLLHKEHREDTELHKGFLNHIRHIRAYKFGLAHCATLCTTLCYTVKLVDGYYTKDTKKTQSCTKMCLKSDNPDYADYNFQPPENFKRIR